MTSYPINSIWGNGLKHLFYMEDDSTTDDLMESKYWFYLYRLSIIFANVIKCSIILWPAQVQYSFIYLFLVLSDLEVGFWKFYHLNSRFFRILSGTRILAVAPVINGAWRHARVDTVKTHAWTLILSTLYFNCQWRTGIPVLP